jgi:hypothetical protein
VKVPFRYNTLRHHTIHRQKKSLNHHVFRATVLEYPLLHEVNSGSTKQRTHANGTSLHRHGTSRRRRSTSGVCRICSLSRFRANAGSRSGLSRSVRSLRCGACTLKCGHTLLGSRIGDGSVSGVENLVNDVDDTIGDQNIGSDNTSRVDKDTTIANCDGKRLTVGRCKGSAV